jgi:hypothetical protein
MRNSAAAPDVKPKFDPAIAQQGINLGVAL